MSRLYTANVYGIQIRSPACGATNNTVNGNHCDGVDLCLLQVTKRLLLPQILATRGVSLGSREVCPPQRLGTFATENGRIMIHDGYFEAQMHRKQILQDDNYTEHTVYVLRCQWQPTESGESTTWLVSHRFSVFEKLHKDLKRKIPTAVDMIPLSP